MSKLTIEEAIIEKRKLEQEIKNLIQTYELKYDIFVNSIRLQNGFTVDSPNRKTIGLNIEVLL